MNKLWWFFVFILSGLYRPGAFPTAPALSCLKLNVENISSGQGAIYLALYDNERDFSKSREPYRLVTQPAPSTGSLPLVLDSIPNGRYVVSVFHDENDNGRLDKNLFGVPQEAYGFSKNPLAKWGAPPFEEISFVLQSDSLVMDIRLNKWKNR